MGRSWLVAATHAAAGAIANAWFAIRSRSKRGLLGVRLGLARYSMPSARSYDWVAGLLGPLYDRVARYVLASVPGNAEVLDVGCGPGNLGIRLARLGLRPTGVDLDSAMIDRARVRAERSTLDATARPRFLEADVAALPFDDGSFDLVVSTFSMHHWRDPLAGLAEIHRVLRPGGRALIWDVAGPIRRLESSMDPEQVASDSPFGGMRIDGRWRLGPIVLVERYHLERPAGASLALT